MMRGRLIAMEGIDGVGKTLQAELLTRRLARAVQVALPSQGRFGQIARNRMNRPRSKAQNQALFELDMAERVLDVIEPRLADGDHVVLDRYYYSTAAYQSDAQWSPERIIEGAERYAPRPDLCVILDLPVGEALARIVARGKKTESWEYREQLLAAQQVYWGLNGPHIIHCNAVHGPDLLHERICEEVRARFPEMEWLA